MEENVVASAGVSFRISEEEVVATIRDAGFTPARRTDGGGRSFPAVGDTPSLHPGVTPGMSPLAGMSPPGQVCPTERKS
jgi:hypothetical protein